MTNIPIVAAEKLINHSKPPVVSVHVGHLHSTALNLILSTSNPNNGEDISEVRGNKLTKKLAAFCAMLYFSANRSLKQVNAYSGLKKLSVTWLNFEKETPQSNTPL